MQICQPYNEPYSKQIAALSRVDQKQLFGIVGNFSNNSSVLIWGDIHG